MFFLLSLIFSLQQNWKTKGRIGSALMWGVWGVVGGGDSSEVQKMYTYVSKCKKQSNQIK
jgi:hypothetical protein